MRRVVTALDLFAGIALLVVVPGMFLRPSEFSLGFPWVLGFWVQAAVFSLNAPIFLLRA